MIYSISSFCKTIQQTVSPLLSFAIRHPYLTPFALMLAFGLTQTACDIAIKCSCPNGLTLIPEFPDAMKDELNSYWNSYCAFYCQNAMNNMDLINKAAASATVKKADTPINAREAFLNMPRNAW